MLVAFLEHRHDRRFLRAVFDDLDVSLTAFIRAQLSLAALSLVAYTLVLVIARFPFSFAIVASGVALEFIPLVGALTSGILIMEVALVTGYQHWLAILIFLLVWRGLQDYFEFSPFNGPRDEAPLFRGDPWSYDFWRGGRDACDFPVGANHGGPENCLEELAFTRRQN